MNTRDLHTNKVDDYCKVITVELITQLIHLLNFQLIHVQYQQKQKTLYFFVVQIRLDI